MKRKPSKYIPHSKKIKNKDCKQVKIRPVFKGDKLSLDMIMTSRDISFAGFMSFVEDERK